MAQFHVGDQDTYSALVYQEHHPGTLRYLQHQVEQPTAALSETTRAFMDQAKEMYERFSSSDAMRRVRAAGRYISNVWKRDVIRPLNDLGELQHAPLAMQRWLMAYPEIRTMYHQQQCDGYGETYVDAEPGLVGSRHSDYRAVMSGIVVMDEENETWSSTQYFDSRLDDDDEVDLDFDQKLDILSAWTAMSIAVANGDDPTSKWNARCGA